ncbi:MAG: aromatic ring-hydroxylating dioxygenase subunit alpha [Pseudomonadales bacterium]|jgi:phenylpropionate dioxygenase-like ring-hydroxylating dioxygenase large terminal subunit
MQQADKRGTGREQLIEMARHNMACVQAQRIERTDGVLRVPGTRYYDPERWQLEIDRVFRRLPLMLAMSCELRHPGDFKTLEVAGVPVLMVRDQDGVPRAYINSCSHRGAVVVREERGNRRRFSCPYHAWTYDQRGNLVAIFQERDFGEIDKSCHGLKPLPVGERAGMIWVNLNPDSTLDIDTFLCGYDEVLDAFGFADWALYDSRTVEGPNWKIAYDGYMDLYHLPILHRNTFGSDMPCQALYYPWGPHQRVASPDPRLLELNGKPESEWPTDALLQSVWTIFPHVSIASFDGGGGRAVMVSQLFPGDSPATSRTVQNYVMRKLPETDEVRAAADAQFKMLEFVVREEDYATGLLQQRALMTRPDAEVLFGRNEGGGQRFHAFLDELLDCPDEALPELFRRSA